MTIVRIKNTMIVEYEGELYKMVLGTTLNEYGGNGKDLKLSKKRLSFILAPIPKDDKEAE